MVTLAETPVERTHDDRRLFPRMNAAGIVNGHRFGSKNDGASSVSLELRDLSVSGVSGWVTSAMTRGDKVHLSFPADGFKTGFNTFGRVIRCEVKATGYQVAIQFDKLLTQR